MEPAYPLYVREKRNVWHVARIGPVPDMTHCRRVPVECWDERTTDRPARLCKRCTELSGA